ncbi:MAG: hypothetical protein ACR2QO_15775 [Acidimicrobiales bacterium]
MLGQEVVEFLAHGRERTGLDLDQRRLPADVDDEPAELNFELVAGLGVQLLQLRVERAFVQRADVSDATSLGRGQHRVGHPTGAIGNRAELPAVGLPPAWLLPDLAATPDRDEHGQENRSDCQHRDRAALGAVDWSQIRYHRRNTNSDHDGANDEAEQ